jgi:hypothetical protein
MFKKYHSLKDYDFVKFDFDKGVKISDSEMIIDASFFVHKDYSVMNKDLILDIFCKYYSGQTVRLQFPDGENLRISGFLDFLDFLCDKFQILADNVVIETQGFIKDPAIKFLQKNCIPSIFYKSIKYTKLDFDRNLSSAKFVGTLLGRINTTRLRLAHTLDMAFPDDSFMIFQPKMGHVNEVHRSVKDLYATELSWLAQKTFDEDLVSNHLLGSINWKQANETYTNLWNRFQIEVVSETDVWSNSWFTEKTARCLMTGKPFVLVAGTGALATLHKVGFKTFGDIIDETYDSCLTPVQRISRIIESLKTLYTHPDRLKLTTELYHRAAENILVYKEQAKHFCPDFE